MRATLKLVSCFGGVVLCGVGAVRAAASADELAGFRESAEIAVGKGAADGVRGGETTVYKMWVEVVSGAAVRDSDQ